jgi:phosphatidylglycerophosphate synthase
MTISSRHFKWLPNALTSIRYVLAVFIFIAALNQAWSAAFWMFASALVTDFLDGLAAKKLNARTAFGEGFDGWADSSLVVAGTTGLSSSGHLSWWVTLTILIIGAAIGADMVFSYRHKPRSVFNMIASVGGLFINWVGIAWFLATLAFGWHWWYVLATAAILVIAASLKRHRLRVWLGRAWL